MNVVGEQNRCISRPNPKNPDARVLLSAGALVKIYGTPIPEELVMHAELIHAITGLQTEDLQLRFVLSAEAINAIESRIEG